MTAVSRLRHRWQRGLVALLLVPAFGFGIPQVEYRSEGELQLALPFREASVWSAWQGAPRAAWWLTVGVGESSYRQPFGVVDGNFVAQAGDTWFIYGLHGYQQLATKPYGTDYPQWEGRHNGIDFVTVPGLTVRATQSGVVRYVGPGLGTMVIIEHGDGYETTYGYLRDLVVEEGQVVRLGQELGRVTADGPAGHLHFELDRINPDGTVTAVNPVRFLDLSQALIPDLAANHFYLGPDDPWQQNDFVWNRERFLFL